MVEITKIFLNFQFNNISLKALEIAKDLANKYNSQLIIFYEIEDVYMMKKLQQALDYLFHRILKKK
jgi:hypothetical protein